MINHNIVQKAYYFCRSELGVIKRDLYSKNQIDSLERIKMWALGFESDKYYLYDLKSNDHRDYLSDRKYSMTRFINYPYDVILENKIIFEETMSKFIRVPKNYSYINNGIIYPLKHERKIDTVDSILKVCKEEKGLVIKPVGGALGGGVIILKIKDDKIFMNNEEVQKQTLQNYLANLNDNIITEYIKQGEYANNLYPHSTNTMRIVTMVDPNTNKPFIAGAAQRIGGKDTGGLDNFAQGGFCANVDLDSGKLSAARTRFKMENLVWHDKHPQTGSMIKGTRVPEWEMIKSEVLNIMYKVPYIKYVGWDIAITDDDIVFIEGNNYPNVRVIQIHEPLLRDTKVRNFYKYYGII